MTAWEYFVAPLLEHNPGEILNTFGDDGWELVSVVAQPTPSGALSTVAYMKRPKPLTAHRSSPDHPAGAGDRRARAPSAPASTTSAAIAIHGRNESPSSAVATTCGEGWPRVGRSASGPGWTRSPPRGGGSRSESAVAT